MGDADAAVSGWRWAEAISEIDGRLDRATGPADEAGAPPALFVREGRLDEALAALRDAALAEPARAFAEAVGFTGAVGAPIMTHAADGAPTLALIGCGRDAVVDRIGAAPRALPALASGWRPVAAGDALDRGPAMREWLLGAYAFERYKAAGRAPARWAGAPPPGARAEAAGAYFARDLVNTPADDLGPDALEEAAQALAAAHGAEISATRGAALLEANLPMIHAVGRAAAEAPRLIDIRWRGPGADDGAPLITLVGKGVCFDTGGLDLKPAAAMRNMKKDMGGAAAALGAAMILMRRGAAIRLRVLVPAVENAIGPTAFRPGDVIPSRAGLTVEIDNTDAEGRLVLGDALSLALEERPDWMIDFATLTGAARVALGPELPALFCDDEALGAALLDAGAAVRDPLWPLPLHQPYATELSSKTANLKNAATSGLGGAITAALFLKRFAAPGAEGDDAPARPWAHLDLFAWNPKARPGRPEGGEAQGARAVAEAVIRKFGAAT